MLRGPEAVGLCVVYRGKRGENPHISRIIASMKGRVGRIVEINWDGSGSKKNCTEEICDVMVTSYTMFFKSQSGIRAILHFWRFYLYMLRVIWRVRPSVLYGINEDCLVLMAPFKRLLFKKMVIDVRDGMCERIRSNNIILRFFVKCCRRMVFAASSIVVVPDRQREALIVGDYSVKCFVVPNVPNEAELACVEKKTCIESAQKILLVSGTLSEERGVGKLLEALTSCRTTVKVRIVGRFEDESLKTKLLSLDCVEYIGPVPYQESLNLTAGADLVFAYYAPVSVNNIYASPCKVAESLALGVPLLVNSEVKISESLCDSGVAVAVAFGDVEGLGRILNGVDWPLRNLKSEEAIKEYYVENYSWKRSSAPLIDSMVLLAGH